MTKLLKESEVADLIGVSVHLLRRQRQEGGGIPFVRVGRGARGAVRYRPSDVEGYVSSRIRKSTSAA